MAPLHRPLLTLTSIASLLALSALTGCGAGTDTNAGGAGGAGANNSSGGNTFGEGGMGAAFSSGGNSGTGGGCAGKDYTAEKAPLDLFIMLDQSGSMGDPPSNGNGSKWEAVTAGLTTFINQPAATGIGVGIQYFPLDSGVSCNPFVMCSTDADCGPAACGPCDIPPGFPFGVCSGASGDSCDPADYAAPDVEIGVLPGNVAALQASMGNHGPTGGTPTSAALDGAIDHATAWATANVGHVVVVVLATDGDPTSCNTDLNYINGLASAGASGVPPIKTFVIGVGGSVGALNGIASAGGTSQAFMIDQDPDVQTAFINALNQIQGASLPCSYLIPEPGMGEMIDYGKINVSYTPSGGMTQTIPRVDSAAACPANGLAWYYDDPVNPTQIMLCPSTCSTISADTGGNVKIVVGCDTVVQ